MFLASVCPSVVAPSGLVASMVGLVSASGVPMGFKLDAAGPVLLLLLFPLQDCSTLDVPSVISFCFESQIAKLNCLCTYRGFGIG